MKKLVQILGPTGVGKSLVAIAVAEKFEGEIVSADSVQVYCGFDVGTDKVDGKKREQVPHHLIDIIDDCSQFNASRFLEASFRAAEEIIARGNLPVVCGGTAFYLRTMIRGIFPEEKGGDPIRDRLQREASEKGLGHLFTELESVDPGYARKIGPNDRIRIIRALEIYSLHRLPPSEVFKKTRTPFVDYRFFRLGLTLERKTLYESINRRVERMIADGLVEEVRRLKQRYSDTCPPFKAVGYKEILMVLNGKIGLEEAVEQIKQNTRRFAKRQMSWFRMEKDIHWFSPEELGPIMLFLEGELWNAR